MLVKITDRLWLSSEPNLAMVRRSEADAVLCCIKKGSPQEVIDAVPEYHRFDLPDGKTFPEDLFMEAVTQAQQWLAEGRTVLVHCRAGRNRSATVVAMVLILQGVDPVDAIAYVRKLRPRAIANPVMEERLLKGAL